MRYKREKKDTNETMIKKIKGNDYLQSLLSGGRSTIKDIFILNTIDKDTELAPEYITAIRTASLCFKKHNVGNNKADYGIDTISWRLSNGIKKAVLKIGIKRVKIQDTDNRGGNTRFPTFVNKVIPELVKLHYVIGAAYLMGSGKDGKTTLSYMVYFNNR